MAWIEVHQGIFRHRKTFALSHALEISRMQTVGHLISLWHWSLDNAPDGDITGLDPAMIALGAEWEGDPQIFVDNLQMHGWLDEREGGLFLHDWEDYVGRLIEARRHQASQKKIHRDLYNDKPLLAEIKARDGNYCRYCKREVSWTDRKGRGGATYDFVNPTGPTTLQNIVVACRACNAGKNNRTPEEAGYPLLQPQISTDAARSESTTVPYSTLQHHYILTLRAIPGWEERGEPHLRSLLAWKEEKGITDDQMERAAIGLSGAAAKTLKGYANLVSALQGRINKGYDGGVKLPNRSPEGDAEVTIVPGTAQAFIQRHGLPTPEGSKIDGRKSG